MRKLIVIVALAGACLVSAAQPALAQRDPFDPVIDPNAPATTGTTTTGTSDPVFTGGNQPSVDSGNLSNTGSNVTPWLVVAYGLFVLGGIAVVLARMHAPVRRSARVLR